jgi:hypothetical protein
MLRPRDLPMRYHIPGGVENLKLRLLSMDTQWTSLKTYSKHYDTFVVRMRTEYYRLMQFALIRAIKKNEDIQLISASSLIIKAQLVRQQPWKYRFEFFLLISDLCSIWQLQPKHDCVRFEVSNFLSQGGWTCRVYR